MLLQEFPRDDFEPFEPLGGGEIDVGGESPLDKVKGLLDPVMPLIQERKKELAYGLAAIIVLAALYWFFVASVFQVTIRFENTEGDLIDVLSGQIQTEDGAAVKDFFGGQVEVPLRQGVYKVRFNPQQVYATPSTTFEVDSSGNLSPETIVLEKDFDIEVTSFFFPATLSVGQQATFEALKLYNQGSKDVSVELVAEPSTFTGVFESFQFQPSQVFLPAGGEVPVTLSVQVKEGLAVKNEREGDEKDGRIRVKFLKRSNDSTQDFSFKLLPQPDLRLSPTSLDYRTVKAGESESKPLRINNRSDFEVEDVTIEAVIDASPVNGVSEVEEWISFNCPVGSPGRTCTFNLPEGEDETVNVNIEVPVLALNESIRGRVIVSTYGFEEEVDLKFEVEEAEIELVARLSKDEFSLAPTASGFETESANLTIDNRGEIDLEDIDLEVEGCDSVWYGITQASELPFALAAGEDKVLELNAKAPALATPGQTQFCSLTVFYRHPLTDERVELDEIEFSVTPEEAPTI